MRELARPAVPIVAPLDPHANLSEDMLEEATACEPIATTVIEVDARGVSSPKLETFPCQRPRRSSYPPESRAARHRAS